MHTRELFDLTGRVAIVTGGGGGLGRQMARALAEMGADLVLCGRKAEHFEEATAELSALGVRALGVRCDVTSLDDVRALVDRTKAEFGRIDVLVNNAGRAWVAPAATMAVEEWRRVLEVNLTGAFLCAQAAGNVMIEQGGGKIINIASVAGLGGAMPEVLDAIAYNASKGGLINFTRDLAVKWGRHKINVNAIAPGWFPSRMSSAIVERWGDRLARNIPLGRIGGDEDLKGAVVYLASRASDYVTGQVLAVDGGQTAS
jgi:NAD(P)-dependent dehydrogenase (short-subunit alcohol dehydrogenase family)